MKENKNKNVTVYKYKKYSIYIMEDQKVFECYVQHESYGIIMLMFGLPKDYHTTKNDIIEIVKSNLKEQIKFYRSLYED